MLDLQYLQVLIYVQFVVIGMQGIQKIDDWLVGVDKVDFQWGL